MTINSPGFNAHKRDLIFDFARTGSVDFLAVEETFISDENSFKDLTSNCSCLVFCSPVSGKKCGCFLVYLMVKLFLGKEL